MFEQVRGCDLTKRDTQCGQLTQWAEVTPLELKISIEHHMTKADQKVDYDKENECSLCFCTLYEGIKEKSVATVIEEQKVIFDKKMKGQECDINVVKLGKC